MSKTKSEKHTQEPWHVTTRYEYSGKEAPGAPPDRPRYHLAYGPDNAAHRDYVSYEYSRADAERIVACVNACAGIADPGAWREGLFQVRAQRDEMLAALKSARAFASKAHAAEGLFAELDAAIAKAEGRS